ncbi:apolipoprotein N-acyltransferase [Granulicella mallensis]|uniref:apolipoprotein N-acyltransferase n=1 Tax=Granulicella mallensis TaxID=940614 RepID=UPI001C8532A3|nr:apolipoprotein N-acyltransferase [Granulicella mallensis]
MRTIPLRLWTLAILSSLLQVLPFPISGPVPSWRRVFCWFCLVPLLMALLGKDTHGNRLKPAQTALLGYICGFFWYMGNCYWVYRTMHLYGGIPSVAAFGILVLFSLYVGLYHGLFSWLVGLLHRKFSPQTVLWIVPFVWVGVEFARARITGFPWDLLGYTQVDNLTVTRLAPWTGVFGLSFVIVLVNILWVSRIFPRQGKNSYAGPIFAAVLTIVTTLVAGHGSPSASSEATARAVLLQENLGIGAEAPATPETEPQMLASFTDLSLHPQFTLGIHGGTANSSSTPDMIAWPEAPTAFRDGDPYFLQAMGEVARRSGTSVIVNDISLAPRDSDGLGHVYNSSTFFAADGSRAGRYDKMHLVPFGEYTPYKPLFFFVGHLLDDLLFVPGLQRSLFETRGKKYGVFICYESIFGDDIRRFVDDGSQVLVNISDDGWYGDTSAPWEHLDMVRMRAIENNRWVLRATNTGLTAAIDPYGRITASMPRHIRGSIEVAFGYREELTFYTRHGDWFAWICALVSAAMLAMSFMGRRAVN